MNQERAILKGHLAGLKEEKMRIATAIAANLAAVQTFLAGWRIRAIADIDIDSAHYNLREAAELKIKLTAVCVDITKIEAELA